MVAVVYSDSDRAHWKLAQEPKGLVHTFLTTGINPALHETQHIAHVLNSNIQLINHAEQITRVYFFGAGAFSKKHKAIVGAAFGPFFRNAKIAVEHDIQGAALAVCGHNPGIVGILSAGSNAIYFDGKKVKKNNFGLGYILADEGSANWIARMLLKAYLGETLPKSLQEKFKQKFDLDRKQVLTQVYDRNNAPLFLSRFYDFIVAHKREPALRKLVAEGFDLFFSAVIVPLSEQHPSTAVHFVGMVAIHFESILKEVANRYEIQISSLSKEPIDLLLKHHVNLSGRNLRVKALELSEPTVHQEPINTSLV